MARASSLSEQVAAVLPFFWVPAKNHPWFDELILRTSTFTLCRGFREII